MSFYDKLSDRLSKVQPVWIAATATAILIAVPTIRIVTLHRRLQSRITHHETYTGDAARSKVNGTSATSSVTQLPVLPLALTSSPESYRIVSDVSFIKVPSTSLPNFSTSELLTKYLQNNMVLFSTTPQAYILWMATPRADRYSFGRSYLESLPFQSGNLVNGLYRVVSRGDGVCAMAMAAGEVQGRLICSIVDGGKGVDEKVLRTETYMWVNKESKAVMPLERAIPAFSHKLTSWWLLVRGTEMLQRLRR